MNACHKSASWVPLKLVKRNIRRRRRKYVLTMCSYDCERHMQATSTYRVWQTFLFWSISDLILFLYNLCNSFCTPHSTETLFIKSSDLNYILAVFGCPRLIKSNQARCVLVVWWCDHQRVVLGSLTLLVSGLC